MIPITIPRLASIIFITGTSGAGKTTLRELLTAHLPPQHFVVYDVDQNGVPSNADQQWRQSITNYWLTKAHENALQNKSTIICGVTVPAEVLELSKCSKIPIYFGLIKIADTIIRQRLQQRNCNDQLIHDNLNWAHYLEKQVRDQPHHIIIENNGNLPPEKMIDVFIEWFNHLTAL